MIRRLGKSEGPIWRALLIESVESHPENFVTPLKVMQALPLSWFEDQITQQHVVTSGGDEALGVLKHTGKEAYMHSLYVQPHRRGQGLAHAIINHLIKVAADQLKVRTVRLGVLEDNIAAVRLYEGHGFKVTKTKPFGDRVDCEMTRDLV